MTNSGGQIPAQWQVSPLAAEAEFDCGTADQTRLHPQLLRPEAGQRRRTIAKKSA